IQWVRAFLRHLADEGRAILVSSHLLAEIARLVDEVVVIRRGQIVAQGTVADLTASAAGASIVVASTDDSALGAALSHLGGRVTAATGALTVAGLDAEQVGRAALDAGIVLTELRTVSPDL